jgi:hypothetical protein
LGAGSFKRLFKFDDAGNLANMVRFRMAPPNNAWTVEASKTTTLTFDCYGTLIDWESGACRALRNIYGYSRSDVTDDALIDLFLHAEARIIRENIFPYSRVLQRVAQSVADSPAAHSMMLADLGVVWEAHDASVLERLAITDPGKLAQIAYGLLPRDVFISVEQRTPGNLDPDEWAILRVST